MKKIRDLSALALLLPAVGIAHARGSSDGPIAQEAYLKAPLPEFEASFGHALAVWGDTIVVGTVREDDGGSAYVYVRDNGTWSLQADLEHSPPDLGTLFGWSVDIDGDTIVVGEPVRGKAYVFERNGTSWTQEAVLQASNHDSQDDFGESVAISGDTIVVGANHEDSAATGVNGNGLNNGAGNSGAAYVFVRDETSWVQEAYLKASNTGVTDAFGESVAIEGDTLVVGARHEDSASTQVDVGGDDDTAFDAGAAYVFVREAGRWTEQAYLKASNTDAEDQFGISVAVSGDTVLVGAHCESGASATVNGNADDNSAPCAGAAYVFERSGGSWNQTTYLKPFNTWQQDNFGVAVALDGDRALFGMFGDDSASTGVNSDPWIAGAAISGAAFLFARDDTGWTQRAFLKASNTGATDSFGGSVSLFGTTLVVGAQSEDSSVGGVNGDGGDNGSPQAGAAYVFDGGCEPALPAAEVIRNGTPPNPVVLMPRSAYGPVVGALWDPRIEHTAFFPDPFADLLLVSANAVEVDLGPPGTLLCGPPYLATLFAPEPGERFQIPLPADCGLAGLVLHAQGVSSPDGLAFAFTNALELTFGTY